MLIKAILTGGVLSLLAGSIVYFGTEGADAMDRGSLNTSRVETSLGETDSAEETELAGAADSADLQDSAAKIVKVAPAQDVAVLPKGDPETRPESKTKAKTRWLDQYLKSTKSDKEEIESELEPKAELVEEPDTETMFVEVKDTDQKKVIIKTIKKDETVWVSETDDVEINDVMEMDVVQDAIQGVDRANVKVRVVKIDDRKTSETPSVGLPLKSVDYDVVLSEAKKLQVIDMRNEAVLEIIDYAIDRGDIGNAADIVEELSSPELRDTARARIGVGLATRGDMDAAFAVLDEIEIDELSAPIRLEIIAALMATREERAAPPAMRRR